MSAPTTVERVCDVLEVVLANEPISPREIRIATGIDKQTLSRILANLEEAGFVEETNDGARVVGDRLRLLFDARAAR